MHIGACEIEATFIYRISLVPRPFIQRVYRLQYNARKQVRAGIQLCCYGHNYVTYG